MKRRISRRQYISWAQFHAIRPLDGDKRRDHLLALAVTRLSVLAHENPALEYEQLIPDPFEATPEDDMATIIGAFQASG